MGLHADAGLEVDDEEGMVRMAAGHGVRTGEAEVHADVGPVVGDEEVEVRALAPEDADEAGARADAVVAAGAVVRRRPEERRPRRVGPSEGWVWPGEHSGAEGAGRRREAEGAKSPRPRGNTRQNWRGEATGAGGYYTYGVPYKGSARIQDIGVPPYMGSHVQRALI